MSSPSSTTAKEKKAKRERLSPEDRRRQLLDAAITAYAEQGVERAGHGDIAKLTSASTATVFNYFPTREALTDAVLRDVSQKLLTAISLGDTTKDRSSVEILSELLRSFDNLIETDPDVTKVLLNWSVSFGPSVRPQYLKHLDRILTFLHEALNRPMTGEAGERAEARLLYAAAISYATMKLDKSSQRVMDEFVKGVLELFR